MIAEIRHSIAVWWLVITGALLPAHILAADISLKVGEEHTFSMEGLSPGGDVTYYWNVDGEDLPDNESSITAMWEEAGEYVITAWYQVGGCTSPQTSITVEVVDDGSLPDIYPAKFFTPNGDGVNDTWEIGNIEYYPDAHIEIYDRYHKCLIKYRGTDVGWDGNYNGHQMPSTDYWYYIRDGRLKGGSRSGHFILKR